MTTWRNWILWTFISVVLFFSLAFSILQTNWGKSKLSEWIVEAAKKEGLDLSLTAIEGNPPFKWEISHISFQDEEGNHLTLERCKARIAFFPLLRKQFVISHLRISKALYEFIPSATGEWKMPRKLPSINLSIKHLKIVSLTLENQKTHDSLSFHAEGKGRLRKKNRELFLDLRLAFSHSPTDYVQFLVSTDRKRDNLSVGVKAQLQSTKLLQPLITLPFEIDFHFLLALSGPWSTWSSIYKGTPYPVSTLPLSGKLQTEILRLDLPQIKEIDRRWKIDVACEWHPNRSLVIETLSAQSDIGWVEGSAEVNPIGKITATNLQFFIPELDLFNPYFPTPIRGSVEGSSHYLEGEANLSFIAKNISLLDHSFPSLSFEANGINEEGHWNGNFNCNLSEKELPLSGKGEFCWEQNNLLTFDHVSFTGPDTELGGSIAYDFANKGLLGDFSLNMGDLTVLKSWLPKSGISGKLEAKCHLSNPELQTLIFEASLFEATLYRAYVERGEISATIDDLFKELKGSGILQIQKGRYKEANISNLLFKTESQDNDWGYTFDAEGVWRDPWNSSSNGRWVLKDKEFLISVENMETLLLKHSLIVEKPFELSIGNDSVDLSDISLFIDESKSLFSLSLSPELSEGVIQAEKFPLDLLFLSRPGLFFQGSASIDGIFKATQDNLTGRLALLLQPTEIFQFGKAEPTKAKGFLQLQTDRGVLQLQASLLASGDQILDASASLPIHYQTYPLKIGLDKKSSLSAELVVEGRLEEIFDFVNLGSHKVTGNAISHLFFSKTVEEPLLNGSIEITDGYYENYLTGTTIKDLNAFVEADRDKLNILTMTGTDGKEGTVSATGTIAINAKEKFPYIIDAELDNLNAIRFDMISSNLTGPLKITGTTEGALAEGSLLIPSTLFRIPEELPVEIPVLPVTFVNEPLHLEAHELNPPPIFPFHLDLNLYADNNVIVTGRGLNAELEGSLHLTGTNMTIQADGTLTLIKGKYEFSGKTFNLTEGEISFTDIPNHKTRLNIKGSLSIQDKTIIAVLNGPLSSPVLTFQSLPSLPTSSILSLILFNKDITEIHRFEAIQLAQTLISLSGGAGPGIIEKIRKSLGIDRLTISSNPNNEDEIAVQIGKYLTRGLMVTLAQGTTSSQIIVEMELKHGFILQAETQQIDDEQGGKFSLKWNKNY